VSKVSAGHLKFKFQRLLKKFFIGPQPNNFMVLPLYLAQNRTVKPDDLSPDYFRIPDFQI
jgi:hypothetical protein